MPSARFSARQGLHSGVEWRQTITCDGGERMRRPPARYLPHSYALMAVGAALTVFIVVQLVQHAQATYAAWPVFVAGLVTAAYVGLVVGILLYVPRKRL